MKSGSEKVKRTNRHARVAAIDAYQNRDGYRVLERIKDSMGVDSGAKGTAATITARPSPLRLSGAEGSQDTSIDEWLGQGPGARS